MGLAFYDKNKQPFGTSPFRSFFDGHLGGVFEEKVYLRNDDPSVYYTNIVASIEVAAYQDTGETGTTGWGVKLMYGERRPTEAEWDAVRPSEPIVIPDIGTTALADTFTYHPIWIRIFCPGNEPAQIRENQKLKVSFFKRKVGA